MFFCFLHCLDSEIEVDRLFKDENWLICHALLKNTTSVIIIFFTAKPQEGEIVDKQTASKVLF